MHIDLKLGGATRRLAITENAVISAYELTGDDFFALGSKLADAALPLADKMRTMRLLAWTCLCDSQKWEGKRESLRTVSEWLEDRDKRMEVMAAVGKLIADYIAKMAGPPEFEGQLAPFVPTPMEVVERMVALGDVDGKYVVDLGAGDGRLMKAALEADASEVHGYELHPGRFTTLEETLCSVWAAAYIYFADIRTADLSDADVVFLYLLPTSNAELKAKLLAEMKPGSLIISHDFDMPDWEPEHRESVKCSDRNHSVYVWRIPTAA